MNDWKLPWEGGCRCDQTRVRVSAASLISAACHCTGCERMSASAFSLTLAIPMGGFEVTQGKPVIGGLHESTHHYFCSYCMSWMFTRPEGMNDVVNLRPSMLDDHSWVVPFIEVWTQEKLPWANTPAVHSYATQPAFAEYAKLLEEFARNGWRPA